MFKILKNLKETWVSVIIIVLLLCLQAWADLTLPDYTSKIVNVGIVNGDTGYILEIGMQMLGIAFISMVSAISIMLLSSRVAAMLGKT